MVSSQFLIFLSHLVKSLFLYYDIQVSGSIISTEELHYLLHCLLLGAVLFFKKVFNIFFNLVISRFNTQLFQLGLSLWKSCEECFLWPINISFCALKVILNSSVLFRFYNVKIGEIFLVIIVSFHIHCSQFSLFIHINAYILFFNVVLRLLNGVSVTFFLDYFVLVEHATCCCDESSISGVCLGFLNVFLIVLHKLFDCICLLLSFIQSYFKQFIVFHRVFNLRFDEFVITKCIGFA